MTKSQIFLLKKNMNQSIKSITDTNEFTKKWDILSQPYDYLE
ncbi:hypothetical protein FHS77_000863 [Paenochrobactrum gallinarii]|uniref:Uncharacterized protein n=1 Tax=Paenochrobactrum gallinarii TaxID=643673 RepID=A0A841LXG1_9HYPH|nr:hypothetical protein [Paenochrobactrum gallinarii]